MSTHKKIDEYVRKERYKEIITICIMVFSVAIAFLIVYMPPLGKQSDIVGTVVTLTATQHDEGHSLRMIVALDSGETVSVFIPLSRFYQQGKTVKLRKREPLLFGKTLYSFRGYTNAKKSAPNDNTQRSLSPSTFPLALSPNPPSTLARYGS